jgi:ABC-type branched-subunit amino acid transport system ATPase component
MTEGLVADRLVIRYGGRVAVDGVSLVAPTGRVTGLIGPNGAGKTSTFNACSGLVSLSGGSVRLFGEDVTELSAATRARRGLGRTFQRIALFDSLTVSENVALGREAALAGASPVRQVLGARGDREDVAGRAKSAMEACAIGHLARRQAGSLSTGQRRLVELARVLAGDFRILLLDEPSSGLDRAETLAFAGVLRSAVAERGMGILLVEHDMELALNICEHLYVLDFGKPLFEGSPDDVRASRLVRDAYLGSVA